MYGCKTHRFHHLSLGRLDVCMFDLISLLSHPCLQRKPFLAAETILLAFQNYILMLGTSVMIPTLLVPAMGGSDVS